MHVDLYNLTLIGQLTDCPHKCKFAINNKMGVLGGSWGVPGGVLEWLGKSGGVLEMLGRASVDRTVGSAGVCGPELVSWDGVGV